MGSDSLVDYKGKIGIYKAKSQTKYLGEPAVEYHQQCLKTGDFKGISQGGKMKGPNFARWFFMVQNGQISHHEENPLAKFWQGEIHLAKWCSHCLCSCFHLKFKPVNVQNPCLTRPNSSSINWHA